MLALVAGEQVRQPPVHHAPACGCLVGRARPDLERHQPLEHLPVGARPGGGRGGEHEGARCGCAGGKRGAAVEAHDVPVTKAAGAGGAAGQVPHQGEMLRLARGDRRGRPAQLAGGQLGQRVEVRADKALLEVAGEQQSVALSRRRGKVRRTRPPAGPHRRPPRPSISSDRRATWSASCSAIVRRRARVSAPGDPRRGGVGRDAGLLERQHRVQQAGARAGPRPAGGGASPPPMRDSERRRCESATPGDPAPCQNPINRREGAREERRAGRAPQRRIGGLGRRPRGARTGAGARGGAGPARSGASVRQLLEHQPGDGGDDDRSVGAGIVRPAARAPSSARRRWLARTCCRLGPERRVARGLEASS